MIINMQLRTYDLRLRLPLLLLMVSDLQKKRELFHLHSTL